MEENTYRCICMEEIIQTGRWKTMENCNDEEVKKIRVLMKHSLPQYDKQKSVIGYSAEGNILSILLIKERCLREYLMTSNNSIIIPNDVDLDNTYELVGYYTEQDYSIDLFNAAYMLEDRILKNDPIIWVSKDRSFFSNEALYHLGFRPMFAEGIIIKQLD